ncbi:MAG: CpsD/CapB family tyrosine-protein kinase [Gammaproteobacteria bacterium]
MSIVEKAVGRADKPRKDGSKPRTMMSGPVAEVQPVEPEIVKEDEVSIVVRTSDLEGTGLLSIADNAALAQDFRFLKRPLLARVFGVSRSGSATGHIVQLTSDLPGAGKSFAAFNFSVSLAQEQMMKVFLIDGDPLRRNLTMALSMQDQPGLLEVLQDPSMLLEDVALQTDLPSLRFIPAGQPRPNSTELLSSRRMVEALKALDDPDTIVLLDSPPMLLTAEARVLAEQVDHTLVVVEAGSTSVANVDAVLKLLKEAEANVSFILNKAPHSSKERDAAYYGYGYGY